MSNFEEVQIHLQNVLAFPSIRHVTRGVRCLTLVPLDAASQVIDVRRPQLQVLGARAEPHRQTPLKQLCEKTPSIK